MTIEQIDNSRILIALGEDDMKTFSLEFESMNLKNPHVKTIISRLLSFAQEETGISTKNKRMLIEAMQYDHGCLLMVTFSEKGGKRKIYKIKNPHRFSIYILDNATDLLNCATALKNLCPQNIKSDIYSVFDKYALVIFQTGRTKKSVRHTISEYASPISGSSAMLAKIREYGKALALGNAIEKCSAKG